VLQLGGAGDAAGADDGAQVAQLMKLQVIHSRYRTDANHTLAFSFPLSDSRGNGYRGGQ
jgi:hypothetical protein